MPDGFMWWQCSVCATRYRVGSIDAVCTGCGPRGLLDLNLRPSSLMRSSFGEWGSQWRYLPLLPLQNEARGVRRDVGATPLLESQALARRAGVVSVAVKDEGRNPSGSLKDRASTIVAARALELGRTHVVTASSGNAAIALAAACAGTPLTAVAFVPDSIPRNKLAQLVAYGAEVVLVEGGYERAVAASTAATTKYGWYSRDTAVNPYTAQGKKTVALEIAEQVATVGGGVDVVVVPTGDGNILTAVHAGMLNAVALGWLPRIPRLVGVQASGADAIHHAWLNGFEWPGVRGGSSRADSINVAQPADGRRALRAVRDTGGGVVCVAEGTLSDAIKVLAGEIGVFSEPAAATIWPGLLQAVDAGLIRANDRVVLISTGNGLKDAGLVETNGSSVRTLNTGWPVDRGLEAIFSGQRERPIDGVDSNRSWID